MHYKSALFLVVLLVGATISAGFWWEKSKLPTLKQKDFWKTVGNDKYVMVEFYTKACPYCEELCPKMNKIYDEFAGPNSKRKDIVFYKVDGEESPKIADALAITAFPMIYTFKPGDKRFPDKYRFDNTYSDIKGYIEALPSASPAGSSASKPAASNGALEAAEKKIKQLEQRLKEVEQREAQIKAQAAQASQTPGTAKQEATIVAAGVTVTELGEVLKKHQRVVKKSVRRLQKGIEQSFANGAQHSHKPNLTPLKEEKTAEEEEDDDDEVVDYDYKNAWIVRLALFVVIGFAAAIMFDRIRILESVTKNTRI